MNRRRGKQPLQRWSGNVQIRKALVSHQLPCDFCDCLSLEVSFYNRPNQRFLDTTVQHVRQLSLAGCAACALICKVIGPHLPGWRDVKVGLGLNNRLLIAPWLDPITLECHNNLTEIYTNEGGTCPWGSIGALSSGIHDAKSASSQVHQWIQTCIANHPICHRDDTISTLPTRVIEIIGPKEVRLCSPNKTDRALYACLSHCWGNLDVFRTTKHTYNSHFNGIPWDSLPPTYQHAISVCNCLGLRYIWIDSLCIIQDDVDDWRHEGSQMASIYAKSYITIAASGSHDASQGLYRPGAAVPSFEHRLPSNTSGSSYNIYGRQPPKHDSLNLPLWERAWFFQEHVLSHRIVHFTERELIWECSRSTRCECSYDYDKYAQIFCKSRNPLSNSGDKQQPSAQSSVLMWHEYVEAYNQQKLTFESDTLPAIQGLAKTMQHSLGQYYAGLWSDNLFNDLAWYSETANRRRSEYVAPTWSWASMKGQVKWFNFVTAAEKLAEIVSASTTPAGGDPMGEVTDGLLVLRGRCVNATLTCVGNISQGRPGNTVNLDLGPTQSAELLQIKFGEWYPDSYENIQADVPLLLMQMAELYDGRVWFTFFMGFKQISEMDERYERVGCARTISTEARDAFRDCGNKMEIAVV